MQIVSSGTETIHMKYQILFSADDSFKFFSYFS